MSTDLDLPLLPSADQIRRREFATVRRGYDPDQVRDYLSQMAEQVEAIEHELREMRLTSSMTVPEPTEDPYQKLASRMTDVLRSADEKAQEIIDEAAAQSGRMIAEARSDADRIRVDAQARAEEARQAGQDYLQNARDESERLLSGLTSKREALVEHLQEMQSRLLNVAQDLGRAVDQPSPAGSDEPIAAEEPPSDQNAQISIEDPSNEPEQPPDPDVDPRYEDLWSSTETFELRDLFDEDEPD
jgi:cell division initiation protein